MDNSKEDKVIKTKAADSQVELNQIFNEALKEMDSELIETLDFVSKLNFEDSQMFQVTNSYSGTIKENNLHAE